MSDSANAHVVVVGAGQAGLSVCAKLRELGHAGSLTLIGEEGQAPYQRPPLSKAYIRGEATVEQLLLRPATFYAQQRIDLSIGVRATRIAREAKAVHLSDGSALPYDKLVLTTGSCPRRLPEAMCGDLPGIYYLRSLADADALAHEIRPGRRALVIGGGYIGLEAAAVAASRGVLVTLVEAAERILQRVAAAECADYFRALHRAHGVDIREGVWLQGLRRQAGRLAGAALSDGTMLDVDFAIAGIGILPNQELAAAAGLETGNGIVVDAFCRTSDRDILAAGDCTSFPFADRHIRLENVGNAIDQAEAAAAMLMGREAPYRAKPWFWSDQYDTKLQIAGLSAGHDLIVTRHGASGAISFWYYRNAALIAVDAMNDSRAYMAGKQLIHAGRSPGPEIVANSAIDLRSLLKA
jgi:3-phenylpropionate/trans-cinnamate dioxygenase ferredoxin reductase subunit